MPFPFFRLSFEIRQMIYQNVFTPADKHKSITPDIRPFLPEYDQYRTTFAKGHSAIALHCRALSLTWTCQQAHEEGTNVLYGQNSFKFSDEPYFEDSPFPLNDPPSGVFLPFCEVTYLYNCLSGIGKANLAKIRHVELIFDTGMFLTFPAERNIWTEWARLDRYAKGGAGSVSDALDFLSENHGLQSLDLSFGGSYGGVVGFSVCFSKHFRLARRFTRYTAIEKFRCDADVAAPGHSVWDYLAYQSCEKNRSHLAASYEDAIKNYQELKLKLELEAAHRKESRQHDSYPTKRRFQSEPISQHEASLDTVGLVH